MPLTCHCTMIEAAPRLAVITAAYAVAISLVAACVPTVLTRLPMTAFLPKPQPVVARVAVESPSQEHGS